MVEVHLDTDVLIDLIERKPLNEIISLMERYDFKISAVVFFEFMVGVYRTGRTYLKPLILNYIEVLPITREIADKSAEIEAELMKRGEPIDARDLMIASTAIVREAMLWTNNLKHFQRLKSYGLKLFNSRV
ncbi:MAG TPA: type II toxin-antitoxin system VapC family toxin [Thermoprotei archaeon]|nr:type II toxin-antitoxin system VapC family toxin [Thermoprotei archaeon]